MNLVELLFSNFDFIVISSLLVLNFLILKIKLKKNIGCLITGLIFGLVLPLISIKLEINKVTAERQILDSFELLYVYFRFPIYWIIGIIQLFALSKESNLYQNNSLQK